MSSLKKTILAWPFIFGTVILACWLTELAAKHFFGIDLPVQQSVAFVKGARGWNLVKILFTVIVVAPVMEEFIFRFLLYKVPRKGGELLLPKLIYFLILYPIIVAVISSVLFSMAHYYDVMKLFKTGRLVFLGWNNAFIALFLFGMAQCWLYKTTSWLWSPILNHALFNATNVALIFILPEVAK